MFKLKIEEKSYVTFCLSCLLTWFERTDPSGARSEDQVLVPQKERRAAPAASAARLATAPDVAPDSDWMKIIYQSEDLWSTTFLSLS